MLGGCTPVRPLPPPVSGNAGGIPSARLTPGEPWTGWDDAREPLISYFSAREWTVSAEPPAAVQLERATGRTTANRRAMRLSTAGAHAIERVFLRPSAPFPIPEPFDSVEIRLGGDDATPLMETRPELIVHLTTETAEGSKTREISLGAFPARGWRLAHYRIPDEHPLKGAFFSAIEIRRWDRPAECPLFLDGLTFYLESRAPIVPAWRADPTESRPMAFLSDSSEGDGPHSFLPPVPDLPIEIALDVERHIAEFAYSEDQRRIAYVISFREGIRRVEVRVNGAPVGAFDGLKWAPDGPPSDERCIAFGRAASGAIEMEFSTGRRVGLALHGRSLVFDATADDREVAMFETPVWKQGDPVAIPFLNAPNWIGPAIWRAATPDGQFRGVAAAWLDPEWTGATRWEWRTREGEMHRACRALYEPALRVRRPPLHERLVFTVAARVEDVLPAYGERAAKKRIPLPTSGFHEFPVDDDALHPLSPVWSRDFLRRDTEAQWIESPAEGRYAVKWPMLPLILGPTIEMRREEWDKPDTVFATLLSERPPWSGVDYDARVPHPARFRPPWMAWRQWMREVARQHGKPVVGRDDWVWMNAPALDAWRIAHERADGLLAEPANPIFSLLRLNPLGEGLLPPPADEAAGFSDAVWDRWTATLLWYGLSPGADLNKLGPHADRAQRLTEEIRRRTRGRVPERIAFYADRTPVSATDALYLSPPSSASRLYLRYEPGLEIWINRDRVEPWRVAIGDRDWTLPPNGFAARADGFFAFSGLTDDGARADIVMSGDEIFFDPRGRWATLRDWAADGAFTAHIEKTTEGEIWNITLLTTVHRLAVRRTRQENPVIICHPEGTARGEWDGDWLCIFVPEGAVRLRIY